MVCDMTVAMIALVEVMNDLDDRTDRKKAGRGQYAGRDNLVPHWGCAGGIYGAQAAGDRRTTVEMTFIQAEDT